MIAATRVGWRVWGIGGDGRLVSTGPTLGNWSRVTEQALCAVCPAPASTEDLGRQLHPRRLEEAIAKARGKVKGLSPAFRF